jgi:tetratricopeptide (TPR) repeat protein
MPQTFVLAVSLIAASSILHGQETPAQGKDSIVVSAGISKEQLALEDRLNGILSAGDQALKSGNNPDAIKLYEDAFDLLQKEPLLAEQKDRVLKKLGTGYFQGKRMKDAIRIFSDRVDAHRNDCESQSTAISKCADAESDLGTAKMYDGDFSGALLTFQDTASKFAAAEKLGGSHEFTMVEMMHEAEAKVSIALALFQLGKRDEAITYTESAILELTAVRNDQNVQSGIHNEAAASAEAALSLLSRLRAAH